MTHAPLAGPGSDERGMTLVEMLVALAVFSVVLAGTLGFIRAESRSFTLGNERMGLLQNTRYALGQLEQDLRTAGTGTTADQPFLVYAGPAVVAFNGNYASNVANDIAAVYVNPDAPAASVAALTWGQRITIPLTGFGYPDTSYFLDPQHTVNGEAETLIFYFALDTSTARTDDYALYRRVNTLAPELVARNLLATPGLPFFEYHRLQVAVGGATTLAPVPAAALPLAHSVPLHHSPADSGAAARIDSVRAIVVNVTASNGRTDAAERRRSLTRMIRLPNAGLRNKRTCGDEPILGVPLGVAYVSLPGGVPSVNVSWTPAIDEISGERDVVRYVMYRRPSTDPEWHEPYQSVPAGSPNYVFSDVGVESGESYYYALGAQDCTPSLSTLSLSGPVGIP